MRKVLYEAFIIIKIHSSLFLGEYFHGQFSQWSSSSCIIKPVC